MADLTTSIRNALTAISLPPPSTSFLRNIISARNPPPPLPSLIATAKTRLLAADLCTPGLLDPSAISRLTFPPGILPSQQPGQQATPAATSAGRGRGQGATNQSSPAAEVRLPRDVVVQVLDIENLSRSRWEQVEELEAIERGELTRGREVIRVRTAEDGEGDAEGDVPPEDRPQNRPQPAPRPAGAAVSSRQAGGQGAAVAGGKNATHKLTLQDARGVKVYALERARVEKLGVGTTLIGEKLLIKSGAIVARGMLLLDPETCKVLGGKVEAWQKAWVEGRLARLKEAARPGEGRD